MGIHAAALDYLVLLLIVHPELVRDRPFPPAWSPDHRIQARTTVDQRNVSPEGANFCLYFDQQPAYPAGCPKCGSRHPYTNGRTFLASPLWSPDGKQIALLEKVFSWEYGDPFNSYFGGWLMNEDYLLAIVPLNGAPTGYDLGKNPPKNELSWSGSETLVVDGKAYDLKRNPPLLIR